MGCLESTFSQWKSSSPPGDDLVKTITPDQYDKFESSKDRSKQLFKAVDVDGSGHIEPHELHEEIIKAVKAKSGRGNDSEGRLSHEELDSLISHHLEGEHRIAEDESLDGHLLDATHKARQSHLDEL